MHCDLVNFASHIKAVLLTCAIQDAQHMNSIRKLRVAWEQKLGTCRNHWALLEQSLAYSSVSHVTSKFVWKRYANRTFIYWPATGSLMDDHLTEV